MWLFFEIIIVAFLICYLPFRAIGKRFDAPDPPSYIDKSVHHHSHVTNHHHDHKHVHIIDDQAKETILELKDNQRN